MKKCIPMGKLVLGRKPLIAVPFAGGSSKRDIQNAKKGGMDIAEVRIDLFSSRQINSIVREIKKFKNIPVIATIRSKREGGKWGGTEAQRLLIFKAILPYAAAVDIELASKSILLEVVKEAHRLKKTVIVSYHNFKATPTSAVLKKILKDSKSAGADIIKIAVMARSAKDVRALAEFTHSHASEKLVTLSMGKIGMISRILFPSLGSLLTYANAGRSTAPGQWDLCTTARLFKKLYSFP